MTESRRDASVTSERHEMRHADRGDANSGSRTVAPAESRLEVRTDSAMTGSNDPIVREPIAATDQDSAMAAEQSERVSMVTAETPPLSRIETPAHELGDGEFWVAGLWRGESGTYVWQSGRIERDRTGQLYVPANWAPSDPLIVDEQPADSASTAAHGSRVPAISNFRVNMNLSLFVPFERALLAEPTGHCVSFVSRPKSRLCQQRHCAAGSAVD